MRDIRLLGAHIRVGRGVLQESAIRLATLEPRARKVFVLTDRNCRAYARKLVRGLDAVGAIESTLCILPPGETQKRLSTAARLYELMARAHIERRSALVAVGGGVITDLGAFVASTYMRGIPAFLVPTTLLGQVDAAVGGKTGVNLPQGKNLVGTFYQPRAVFSDPLTLRTLPPREYVGGLAEVIKYGMIRDAGLFAFLEENAEAVRKRDPEITEQIVIRCALIKASIVEQDEKESGLRVILNYGHTIGHAIEAAGSYRGLHHGEAVAVGMEAEAMIAMNLGLTSLETLAAQNRILKRFGLPTRIPGLPRRKALAAMKLDKKGADGKLHFVLPEMIGQVRHSVEVPARLAADALRAVTA